MEKRKCLIFLFCLILCYSLFQHTARAQSSTQASIFSKGSITYSPSNVNLAVIPDFWGGGGQWQIGGPSSAYIKYPVTFGGQTTIELDNNPLMVATGFPDTFELDGHWTSINPGDHIVFSVWIWSGASSIGDTNPEHGAKFGLDFYANGRICEIATPDGQTTYPSYPNMASNVVPWGSGQWVHKTMDFVVQSSYVADPWGAYTAGQVVAPTGFIPWFGGYTSNTSGEMGSAWIYGTELYINP